METNNIWVADFETESELFYKKYGYTKTWLCYMENLESDEEFLCIDIEVFIEHLIKIWKMTRKNQYMYFHNLSFDGFFILHALNKMGIDYTTTVNEQKQIYEIRITKGKKYISFRCSYMIFMCSVSSLPNSTKSTIDYETIRDYTSIKQATQEEIYYIKQDVKTVKYNLKMLQDEFEVNLGGRFKTNASISYKEMKRLTTYNLKARGLTWEYLMPNLTLEEDKYIRKSYMGGYTFLNPKYKAQEITEKLVSYDINSSYPTRQRNDYLPFGKPIMKKFLTPKDIKLGRLYLVRIMVYSAEIKDGHMPFLSPNRITRYLVDDIYPNKLEKIMLTLTNIDFELFDKYYNHNIKIIDYCVFPIKAKGVFNEYIDKHYKIKSDGKERISELSRKERSPQEDAELKKEIFYTFISKLRINSTYGKMATNPLVVSSVPEFDGDMLKWTKEEEEREESFYYLPVACFITSYARKDLITVVQENRDRFVYSDTDSVKMIGTEEPRSAVIGKALGEWDYEYTAERSKFMRSKRYIHEIDGNIKRTIGGMSKSQHERVNFDNFNEGNVFEGGRKMAKSVKGGKVIIDGIFTF